VRVPGEGLLELIAAVEADLTRPDLAEAPAPGARGFISFGPANPERDRLMFEGAPATEPPEDELPPRLQLWELYREPTQRGPEKGVFVARTPTCRSRSTPPCSTASCCWC